MRHKVIAGLQHGDGRQNSPAFFPANFERPQTGQVNRRPDQEHYVGAAALPPFGEKDLSSGAASRSGLMHSCDFHGWSGGCQRIFTPAPVIPRVSRGDPEEVTLELTHRDPLDLPSG